MGISVAATTNSLTGSITVPAAAKVGDGLILFEFQGSTLNVASPTNWTSFDNLLDVGDGGSYRASYRIATSTNPGEVITTSSGALGTSKHLWVIREAAGPFIAISATTKFSTCTAGAPAQQEFASQAGSSVRNLAYGMVCGDNTLVPVFTVASPAFSTSMKDGSSAMLSGLNLYSSTGSTQSIDCGDQGAISFLAGGELQFTFVPNALPGMIGLSGDYRITPKRAVGIYY